MKLDEIDIFTQSIFETIKSRLDEAEKEKNEAPKDEFKQGRALAYFEMWEIIKTRLEMKKEVFGNEED